MQAFFRKPYRWAWTFSVLLTMAFAFVLLDTFVIPKARAAVESPAPEPAPEAPAAEESPPAEASPIPAAEPAPEAEETAPAEEPAEPVVTESSYADDNIRIQVETLRAHDTTLYVADITLSDASCLRTALAKDTFGRNIKETTSAMAEENGAIFAVNGDYYGFRDDGYVVRNGVTYRQTGTGDALMIDENGDFSIVREGAENENGLQSAWQVLSFGPVLVENGETAVDESSEISGRSSSRGNPRTAIGQVDSLHYVVIVSDGRTSESAGLSLLELAEEFAARGCVTAYNLDGGGSSTMVLNGTVLNRPTNGRSEKEREVSDIVYIGYE